MTDVAPTLRVQVVYAEPDTVWTREVMLPAGATVKQAIDASHVRTEKPDLCVSDDCLGVFGRRCSSLHELHDGDRVELYRPLRRDPMDARRKRARERN